jgi:UDPglucose 6-dehydrogenase
LPLPSAPERSSTIGVLGLWHLGSVTAACLAVAGNGVLGVDPDPGIVDGLAGGRPPVYEPGLAELLARGAARLRFATDPQALAEADRAWVTFDTPVDEDDHADAEWVIEQTARLLAPLPPGALVIVSSQLPAGSVARLRQRCTALHGERGLRFACVPENLRLGNALHSFRAPARIVAGVRCEEDRRELAELLAPFSTNVLWMRVESAEMLKHALNGFLATSVAFANEIASICEPLGADAAEVARGLKSDPRIGPRAYLDPGEAFAGGTLARDIGFLRTLAEQHGLVSHVAAGVAAGNASHRDWTRRRLLLELGARGEGTRAGEHVARPLAGLSVAGEHVAPPLAGLSVAVWGLTYKPGTDTLRRSAAIDLCHWLAHVGGAHVRAHDPAVHALSPSLADAIELCHSPLEAALGAHALVVCNACPEFREIPADELLAALAQPLILDPAGWLADALSAREGVRYVRGGVPVTDSRPLAEPVAKGSS